MKPVAGQTLLEAADLKVVAMARNRTGGQERVFFKPVQDYVRGTYWTDVAVRKLEDFYRSKDYYGMCYHAAARVTNHLDPIKRIHF